MTNKLISATIFNIIVIATLLFTFLSYADEIKIPMFKTSLTGQGKHVGYLIAKDTSYGLLITPFLDGFNPGLHGFHLHEYPNCEPDHVTLGGRAGKCFDPFNTGQHLGPYNDEGHLGDLPVLYADSKRQIRAPVLAPRLTLEDTIGHSFVICEGSDNYSDEPKKTGGGGARSACGFIPARKKVR